MAKIPIIAIATPEPRPIAGFSLFGAMHHCPIDTFCRTATLLELRNGLTMWEILADSGDWEGRKWARSIRLEVDARRQVCIVQLKRRLQVKPAPGIRCSVSRESARVLIQGAP